MQVFKFGGASVRDAAAIKNVATILHSTSTMPKVVVVSAIGKTTNHLERVLHLALAGDSEWKLELDKIMQQHLSIVKALDYDSDSTIVAIRAIIEPLVKILLDSTGQPYTYLYDQVVSVGEYLSTTIIHYYCTSAALPNILVDARTCIATDSAYTEAKIDWAKTTDAITSTTPRLLESGFVITQGFIGCDAQGHTTTLGREGSDYTAAIWSHCLDAERMIVWKDVPGIMSADPKEFPQATWLPHISYLEAIEMTYYGASVIHPQTIKPIQNKNIPLEVRSFIDYTRPGTVIGGNTMDVGLPPVIIIKREQTLLSFSSRDFSFIAEEHLSRVFEVFASHRLRINMMQNAAISFSICVDTKREKLHGVLNTLRHEFKVVQNESLTLLTIRHYSETIIEQLTADREVLLRQISRNTIQVLMREG